MGPLAEIGIGLGSQLLGIGGSAYAQAQANAANLRIAREQMQFQERMSNTSWQRGMADMQAAGLNPMLAFQQGGASAPLGQKATMQSVIPQGLNLASSAVGVMKQLSEIDNIAAQTKVHEEQRLKLGTETQLLAREYMRRTQAGTDPRTGKLRPYEDLLMAIAYQQATAKLQEAQSTARRSQYAEPGERIMGKEFTAYLKLLFEGLRSMPISAVMGMMKGMPNFQRTFNTYNQIKLPNVRRY